MLIDQNLFVWLALAVAIVGGYLWLKPRSLSVRKPSGVGDHGQCTKKKS